MDPDPDPGGPKTCGSGGSGTLETSVQYIRTYTLHGYSTIRTAELDQYYTTILYTILQVYNSRLHIVAYAMYVYIIERMHSGGRIKIYIPYSMVNDV